MDRVAENLRFDVNQDEQELGFAVAEQPPRAVVRERASNSTHACGELRRPCPAELFRSDS